MNRNGCATPYTAPPSVIPRGGEGRVEQCDPIPPRLTLLHQGRLHLIDLGLRKDRRRIAH